MIPKGAYKLKKQKQTTDQKSIMPRYSTQYHSNGKTAQIKNKLTKGCNKYDELKDAYSSSKQGDRQRDNHLKTDYNEYTFQPKISRKRKDSRSFKKFIEDQENYQMNRENRIRQFKTSATKAQLTQCTSRPEIDLISKRICTLMNYSKDQVVDRLYKQKALQQYKDDQDLFSPKILPQSKSLKRSQNITELLHEDAVRRKSKREVLEAERQNYSPVSPHILSNTYQLVSRKLYSQFCQLAPEEEPILPLVIVWAIVSEIFGIDLNPNKTGRQGKICYQMTKFLCNQGQENVHRQKLWDFIQIITKKGEARSKFFGDQIEQILDNFGTLYTCRIAKPRSQRSPQQLSFFPQTLRSSGEKAQKYRQKIIQNAKQFLENENSKIQLKQEMTIQDIFCIQHMMKKASIQKKKISKQQKMMKQCTFKPRLSQTYKRPSYLPPRIEYSRSKFSQCSKKTFIKSIQSQNLSVTQSFLCNSLRGTNQPNGYSTVKQNKKQFMPLSHKSKQKENRSSCEVKNMDKSIMRMAIARKDRELSNELKNRGYPKNVENWTQYAHQQKKQIAKQHRKLKGLTYKKISLR